MDEKTTMAQGLHSTDDSAGYDAACKRVLSEKAILARIMKACLVEYRDCPVRDIEEKYIEGQPQVSSVPVLPDEEGSVISGLDTEDKSTAEGTVLYDVRFRAAAPSDGKPIGLIINVEAQNKYHTGYPLVKRGIYYCSRMLSAQHGTEFMNSEYGKIKKVCSIWICLHPPKYRENTITKYRIVEENLVGAAHENAVDYDLLSVFMVCVGGPGNKNHTGILRLLEALFSESLPPAEKKKILQDEFDINMSRAFETEMSEMCNLSQGVWEKGVEKGREEGIQALVLSLQKFLKDQALVAKEVAGQFGLTQEAATKSVQQYWKN